MKTYAFLAGLFAASCLAAPIAHADDANYHMMKPLKSVIHTPHARAAATPHARAAATMLYFGGPVISKVNVVAVMWGANVPKATATGIGPFLAGLVNSTFVDQLSDYDTVGITAQNGDPGTGQTISRGSFAGVITITPANKATTLTDKQVTTELAAQIASGALPAANLNTLYMIYFPSSITIKLGSATSCVDFGAYHESVSATETPSNIFYGVMPACGAFASITYASSHEFAEAVTDPLPTPGSHPAFPQAWNDKGGNEIGDLCEGDNAKLVTKSKTYAITQVFNNTKGACQPGKFTSP